MKRIHNNDIVCSRTYKIKPTQTKVSPHAPQPWPLLKLSTNEPSYFQLPGQSATVTSLAALTVQRSLRTRAWMLQSGCADGRPLTARKQAGPDMWSR